MWHECVCVCRYEWQLQVTSQCPRHEKVEAFCPQRPGTHTHTHTHTIHTQYTHTHTHTHTHTYTHILSEGKEQVMRMTTEKTSEGLMRATVELLPLQRSFTSEDCASKSEAQQVTYLILQSSQLSYHNGTEVDSSFWTSWLFEYYDWASRTHFWAL